jgi:hypothetical protein
LLAPIGALLPKALRDIAKGGIVVCGGIHMSDIPPEKDLIVAPNPIGPATA